MRKGTSSYPWPNAPQTAVSAFTNYYDKMFELSKDCLSALAIGGLQIDPTKLTSALEDLQKK
jgi:hypothetical protein